MFPQALEKHMDVFLRTLVDKPKQLQENEVKTRDAVDDSKFKMRVALLQIVNDFPTQSNLSRLSEQGYKVYPTCNEHTPLMGVLIFFFFLWNIHGEEEV